MTVSGTKRNIWTLDSYTYKAVSSGISVYDLASENLINFLSFPTGVEAVWVNDQYIYIASTVSGVYMSPVSSISGTMTSSLYKNYPDLTSSGTTYIHGNGDYLCVTTNAGVDKYKISSGRREFTLVSGTGKCYQTTTGDYYYVVHNILSESSDLHAIYNSGGRYIYSDLSTINDLHITEGTSIYDNANVIFLATSSGVVVFEEKRGDEANCRKRFYFLGTSS